MNSWICSQIGAREHYAIPRALFSQNRLSHLYTDLPRFGLGGVPGARRTFFYSGGARWWWKLRKTTDYIGFTEQAKWFSRKVARGLSNFKPQAQIFFSYNTGFLEAAGRAKDLGFRCVLGQFNPGEVEFSLVAEERKRWPDWEENARPVPAAYIQRRQKEWVAADRIIVNSEWSRDALIQQGVDEGKLSVVPLCYEAEPRPVRKKNQQKFKVLFLGQVNLRKGIPYLLEAADILRNEPIVFEVAGPVGINQEKVAKAPPNVNFTGRIRRSAISDQYHQADLFVLPTLSDGFAITQLEAMAHGMPVISTPNCGRVVEDGRNGFVVPVRDSRSLANRILELADDSRKYSEFSDQARITAGNFSLKHLSSHLQAVEQTMF